MVYGGARAPGTGGVLNLSALNGANGFILNGIDRYDSSGVSVSSAGDVNGDGYDDLIIGANQADPNGGNSGETYVVYGGARAPGTNGVLDLSALDVNSGFILNGIDSNDGSGISVSSAGDVNGDGYDDLIIGADGGDPNGRNNAGETYVVYGGATGTESTVPITAQGTAGADNFIGNAGADSFTGITTGDVVRGGAGDDSIGVTSFDFAYIDGGTGRDVLVLEGSNLSLDLRDVGNVGNAANVSVDSVEVVDLSGTAGNTLVLDARSVLEMTEERAGGMATLDVLGDADDTVRLIQSADQPFVGAAQQTEDGTTYTVYRAGNVQVRVETGVQIQIPDSTVNLSTLDGTNGFTLNGIDRYDESGISVSSAGDVNGDGYDDLIIGANRADPNGNNSGETYVVYGGATEAGGALDLSTLDGANGFILRGIDSGDRSGTSVSSAGDVNGDGYDDLIIGADRADPNGANSGETYVVYGGAHAPGTNGVLALAALDGANGFILAGVQARGYSGISVSSAGDVNGDGYDDLIIGAFRAGSTSGRTYVVYGGASAPGTGGELALSALDGSNGFALTGRAPGDYSGRSVSSAGDVNGDGYDDLIIGAFGADSFSGESYVVYGGATGTDLSLTRSTLNGTNGFTLIGVNRSDRSGVSVSSAGDVNGDGYDDLIIGADRADPNGNDSGETYVVYGGARAPGTGGVLNLSALDGANGFILNGIDSNDSSGISVSSAGDVNGDGYDDLIIGANQADPNGGNSGETYVVYGGASAPGTNGVLDLSALDVTNGFILNGIDSNDSSGISVSSAGDVNGDGYDDLIIGADGGDPNGRNNAGETYVVYGGATGTESTAPITAQGTAGADNFIGNAGADSFTGIATGDVVRGGAGDDSIGVTSFDFADIDGGTGRDALVLEGSNLSLDLRDVGNVGNAANVSVDSVEVVDLSGTAGNTLVLDARSVLELTEERAGGMATLDVLGDADDAVRLIQSADQPFVGAAQQTEDGTTYTVYRAGNVQVRVETGVQIQIPDSTVNLSTLDGTNGFTLNGIDGSDYSGISVSSAGDVNGDGYDDLIIGAEGADPNGRDSGETYLVYGGANAPGTTGELALSDLDGTNGFVLNGVDQSGNSGSSVSSAGDVNGDGYDDLIIGANRGRPIRDGEVFLSAGQTYVVYGGASAPGTGGVLELSALDGANGFTLNGINQGDNSGISVSSAGDVNGDGYDDLIIGAIYASPGDRLYAGETYVVYGGASAPGTGGVLELSALDGANGFTLDGDDRFDRSGFSVSSAGDVNGDGYDDLIIGAYRALANGQSSGETYVVYGGATGTDLRLNRSTLDGANGFTLTGIDPNDQSGISVSSAGDVNGDGYDDLIIGANRADPNGESSGETYVVYGGARAPGTGGVLALSALNGANGFILTGIDSNDQSGISVSSAGDVNGDGYDDLIIGANQADPNGGSSGETYVVYGGATGTERVLDLSMLDVTNGFILTGIGQNDNSGRSVSSAGDVNGDGYDDLIIGANGGDPNGRNNAGETYVVYGGATGTESTAPVTEQGTAAADNFTGNAGADSFTGIATGDVVRGGAGDDSIGVTSFDFADIDGGTGRDALVLEGSNLSLDLRDLGNAGNAGNAGNVGVDSVEVVDLSGTGGNTLVLDARTVLELTEERAGGLVTLDVLGGADDTVRLIQSADQPFVGAAQQTEDGTTYTVYRAGNVQVRVETGVQIQIPDSTVNLSTLDGTNGFTLNGIDGSDYSGISVSSAGDVNGDGYDDLIIGAEGADPNGRNSGETYLVYGGANAPGTTGELALSDLDGTNGFVLNGVDQSGNSGSSVSSAGDVNGDGYDDLIIGANRGRPVRDGEVFLSAGQTYVVYGGASAPGTGGVLELSALDGANGFTLNGINQGDNSGISVSSAGDVNGDGYDDLIIGAIYASPGGRLYAGETYVVYGGASAPGTGGVLELSALDGANGFTLDGDDRFDRSGFSVSSAGDVNGDGYDDLIIGAYRALANGQSSGETYVVYGGATGTDLRLNRSTLDGANGFTLTGIDPNDQSGISVSSAGDVNGDGYDDLIIGANRADPNGESSGETYVVYGGARAPGTGGVLALSALNGANGFILTGIDPNDQSGISVSSAGDVNGDGYDDLIIGANQADPNGGSSGETYVVYGGATGTERVLDLSMLDVTNGFILNGIGQNDNSGRSVSSAGDVNGDGYDDLIIGANGGDPNGRNNAGETYVVYGGATGTESTAPITEQGTAAADNFTGNAGADSFTGIATGDVVRGGAGDDSIGVTSLDFADIDGGTGRDTLVLDGAGLSLDLTGAGPAGVGSVEVFDLSGTGANSLVLDAQAVFDLTEERAGGIATLDVLGDANDRVELRDSNFTLNRTVTEDGTTYNVYRDGNAEVRVQDGVAVTPGTMSSSLLSGDPNPAAMAASPAPDLSRLDALVVTGDTGLYQLRQDGDLMDSLTEWMDNGPRNDQWHDRWHGQQGGLWDGSFQTNRLNSLDKPDSHRLNQEPVFEDLSVRDSVPDMQDTGEDAVLMSLPVPALTPMAMAQPVFAGDTPLHNDLAMILQDMEIFADPVKHGDTDMDGF